VISKYFPLKAYPSVTKTIITAVYLSMPKSQEKSWDHNS